jgi:DNA-binding response OmpR family regulator
MPDQGVRQGGQPHQILEQAWGYSKHPLTNVVEVYIRQLRRKVDQDASKPLIQTVRGFGYKIRIR